MNEALNMAINTPSGTPPYYIACNICQLRGIDPHGQAMTAPVSNWQAIIIEQVLCSELAMSMIPVGHAKF